MTVFDLLTTAGFVVASIPHVFKGYKYLRRSRAMKVFWDGKDKNYIIIYPAHADPSSPSNEYRLIKHETVSAIRRIEEFLKAYGCNVTVKRSSDGLTDQEKKCNVVVIGSSRTNRVAKEFFPDLEKHFEFGVVDQDYFILDKHSQISLSSPIGRGISADLALIEKIPNAYSSNLCNRVYYIAGIHAVGCWAAAEYLTDYEKLLKLPRVTPSQGLAFIIEAQFSGFYNITGFTDYVVPRLI